jgi:hypothetical protein
MREAILQAGNGIEILSDMIFRTILEPLSLLQAASPECRRAQDRRGTFAPQARAIGKQRDRRFTNGTNPNIERFQQEWAWVSVAHESSINEQTGTVSKGVSAAQPAQRERAHLALQKVDSA